MLPKHFKYISSNITRLKHTCSGCLQIFIKISCFRHQNEQNHIFRPDFSSQISGRGRPGRVGREAKPGKLRGLLGCFVTLTYTLENEQLSSCSGLVLGRTYILKGNFYDILKICDGKIFQGVENIFNYFKLHFARVTRP